MHDLPPKPSYARHEPLQHFKVQFCFIIFVATLFCILLFVIHFLKFYCDYFELMLLQMSAEDASTSAFKTSTNLLLIFVSAATVIFIVFAIVLAPQRPRRRGFIEVSFFTNFQIFVLKRNI